ncbi:serine hydrolase [Pleionea sp. CnH1-48]|uniref:serine hydrolase domain-containing protein n=1 Tax=Pleionea sp. CnH1-48 TaxID=2954494 RepID=UPI0020977865|nr:serine hydrolase domain-containing protein [Pleionea sp. CnH1-48]MCO7223413.1 beta-lactamase family protein [Pleionea sp. CnH1-48]
MMYKHTLFKLLISTALIPFTLNASDTKTATPHAEEIRRFEQSLRTPIKFEGDKSWTLKGRMKHYGIHGISIAVIEDFNIKWHKAYGIQSLKTQQPVTSSTRFQAGSISKPLTALATLQLVQQGKISLDQEANKALKRWKIAPNLHTQNNPVQIKHLINHSAGLTVHGFDGYDQKQTLPSVLQILNGRSPANSDAVIVNSAPGELFRYSGGGYTVLQQLLSDVADQPFATLMQTSLLQPLGMTHSTFDQSAPQQAPKQYASGYLPDGKPVADGYRRFPEMAAAGLWTTADDLAKFVIALQKSLKGDKHSYISQEYAQKMITPSTMPYVGNGLFLRGTLKGYGDYFEHSGGLDGFTATLVGHQRDGYGIVILTNANQPDILNEIIYSIAEVNQWQDIIPPLMKAQPFNKKEIERMSGTYQYDDYTNISVFAEADRVYAQYSFEGAPKDELFKIAENTYVRRERPTKIRFIEHKGQTMFAFVEADGTVKALRPLK